MKIKLSKHYIPVKSYRVISKSEPDFWHTIILYADGSMDCDCIAGSYNKMCSHQIRVREHIKKNEPEIYKTLKEPKVAQKSKK